MQRQAYSSVRLPSPSAKCKANLHLIPVKTAKVNKINDSSWSKEWAKETLTHAWWECRQVRHYGVSEAVPQEARARSTSRSSYTTLGAQPKDCTSYHRHSCSSMLTAALLITARNWRRPRELSTDEWIMAMWNIAQWKTIQLLRKGRLKNFR